MISFNKALATSFSFNGGYRINFHNIQSKYGDQLVLLNPTGSLFNP